jgi:hypothetical protein
VDDEATGILMEALFDIRRVLYEIRDLLSENDDEEKEEEDR